jgi:hypothetical protein
MKKIIAIISTIVLLSSCEKEIEIDLNSSDPQIVIEGNITDAPGPYFVKITETVNFSDGNNYPPVSNALVIISDNTGIADTLTETSNGIYKTNILNGQPGKNYNLSVTIEDKNYYAVSAMPQKTNLDTLRFIPFDGPGGDNRFSVIPIFTDPTFVGNNYRFLLTVNGIVAKSYILFNDNVNNGNINQRPIFDRNAKINMGDSVKVEMRCIDLNTFTYFYTLSQIAGNSPRNSTTPSNPPNNITGNKALGYFSAHTVQTRTQKVK